MGRPADALTMGVLALLLALLQAGCASGSRTPADDLPEYEKTFRPSEFDPPPAVALGEGDFLAPDTLTQRVPSPPISEEDLLPGFRVQIFSSPDIDEAAAMKAAAEERLPAEWFYLVYEPPAYKVRAGDFLHRYDADRLAKTLRGFGYSESWIVPDRVVVNPGPRPPSPPPGEEPRN